MIANQAVSLASAREREVVHSRKVAEDVFDRIPMRLPGVSKDCKREDTADVLSRVATRPRMGCSSFGPLDLDREWALSAEPASSRRSSSLNSYTLTNFVELPATRGATVTGLVEACICNNREETEYRTKEVSTTHPSEVACAPSGTANPIRSPAGWA